MGTLMKDVNNYEVPMTVGAGIAYKNRFDRIFFNQYQVALDYTDILGAYEDGDFMKKTRIGASFNVFDGWIGTFGLQAGLRQGHPSLGADFRISMIKLAFASYTEELGENSGDIKDKRTMIQVSIGW